MNMPKRSVRMSEGAGTLEMDAPDVYALIGDRGELRAGRGRDGVVYVPEQALRGYQ